MSLAWFMLEDPSITKSFHQKNLPWPSSSHHWIHQVADYLTSSHTDDGAAPVCMQLLFNHRTRQDCPRDGELGCCHSTGYKDFSLFGGPWPLLHFGWVTKQLYNGSRPYIFLRVINSSSSWKTVRLFQKNLILICQK